MSKKTAIFFVLITIFAATRESEGLTTTVKRHLQPKYTKWLDLESGGEDLVYVMCNSTYRRPNDTHCVVTRESTSFRTLWTCNVTLKYKPEVRRVFPPVRAQQFGRDKALLIWITNDELSKTDDGCTINFLTVHLTSCRTSEIFALPVESFGYQSAFTFPVWTYDDDTFDVIYPNYPEGCGGKWRTCKLTVDAEGKPIVGPVSWLDVGTFYCCDCGLGGFPLIAQTRSKGYLLLDYNSTHIFAALGTNDGLEYKTLASYRSRPFNMNPIHSTAHHTIGICVDEEKPERKFCEQYTLSGQLKLKVVVNLQYYEQIDGTSLYNLANGGFLLVRVVHFGRRNLWSELTKVDGNGQVIGTLKITGFQCSGFHLQANKLFEDVSRKQCLTFVCQTGRPYEDYSRDLESLDFVVTCFTDDDFQLH